MSPPNGSAAPPDGAWADAQITSLADEILRVRRRDPVAARLMIVAGLAGQLSLYYMYDNTVDPETGEAHVDRLEAIVDEAKRRLERRGH